MTRTFKLRSLTVSLARSIGSKGAQRLSDNPMRKQWARLLDMSNAKSRVALRSLPIGLIIAAMLLAASFRRRVRESTARGLGALVRDKTPAGASEAGAGSITI